jgi:hypothetical protein
VYHEGVVGGLIFVHKGSPNGDIGYIKQFFEIFVN